MNGFEFQSHSLDFILIAASSLLIVSVLASRVSSAFGMPLLLLFLGIGMLAGSEGPGQFVFSNYRLAFAVGSVCLAFIIFDGGLRTSWNEVRPIVRIGSSLSVVGTLVTGAATGIFARYAFGLPWVDGLLLGAIVSSTDAAAVFSILRGRNLSLKGRLKQMLEFEAGSNDPVAIMLTIGVLSIATAESGAGSLLKLFAAQAGFGIVGGWYGGRGIRWLINHVGIEHEGLYSVLLFGLVVCLFAVTSSFGGSGFLAVYIAGLFLGNSELIHKGSIVRFQDGVAWIAQILVFLTFGLLAVPSHLLSVWKEGLLLSLFMIFVARPLSVLIAAPGRSLAGRERVFISWVGLRGAAPIILATLPWSMGFPGAEYYFNLVFFVVLTSVVTQGISIPWVAKTAGVAVPLQEEETGTELSAGLLPPGVVSVVIEVRQNSAADNKRIVDLAVPQGVLLTSIERRHRYLIPNGNTVLVSGDKVWGLARPTQMFELKKLFGHAESMS